MTSTTLLKTPIPFVMMGVYIICVFYLSFQASIKARLKRKDSQQTFEDFYTGGKSMSAVIVGLVTIVTFYSGTTFTGRVGFFYNFGVVALSAVFACSATGIIMFFLAEKVWPISKKYRLSTLSDLLELRYQSKYIKLLVGITIVTFNIVVLVSEIRTLGFIVNIASGGAIDVVVGSAIIFTIITIYVCTGGIRSVAAVDSFSSALMLAGSIVVVIYVVFTFYGGSIFELFKEGIAVNPSLAIIDPKNTYGFPYWISSVIMTTIVMLIYPANYMSICLAKSVKAVKKSAIATAISGPWLIIYGIFALAALGLGSKGFVINNPESALLEMISYGGSGIMLGLVTTFVLAASLGSLDSTLIVLSGIVSNDIIANGKSIARKESCLGQEKTIEEIEERTKKNAKTEVLTTRLLILFLSVAGFIFSLRESTLLVLLIQYASNGLVQILPTVILGLYWRKSTPMAAMISIPIGIISYLAMDYYSKYIYFNSEGLPFLGGFLLGLPALIINFVVFIAVSLMTYKKYYVKNSQHKDIYKDFFAKIAN